ncbi:recombinase family protein, partial [Pseudofrankia sp. BMG5.37]|nr:recombinase family protein [Pseudofrankia sp. BMG5.37]MDT3446863.1 recombinase family protein [Pseudofrankia sp. BMG5.37]
AVALNMPTATLYNWIYRGWITAQRHPDGRSWIILADDAEIRRLRERRDRPPGYYTRARWTQPHPAQPDPSTNGTQT